MKKITSLLLLLGAVSFVHGATVGNFEHGKRVLAENPPARQIKVGKKATIPLSVKGKPCVEIVISPRAVPVVRVAAEELQNFLSVSLGGKVPVVRKPGKALSKIFLGDTPQLRKLGVDPEKTWCEGYIIRTQGTNIFIAGKDDPRHFGQGFGEFLRGHDGLQRA